MGTSPPPQWSNSEVAVEGITQTAEQSPDVKECEGELTYIHDFNVFMCFDSTIPMEEIALAKSISTSVVAAQDRKWC